MSTLFVPKGKFYPEDVLHSKIIHSLGLGYNYSLYSTSIPFGNLKVFILYDPECFENGKYKEWIGVEDSVNKPVLKILVQRDYNGMGFEYSLFGENYGFPSNNHDDSILELLRSKFPYLPDNLNYFDLNSEEAELLFNKKLEKASEKESELYEEIAKYHEELIREQQEERDERFLVRYEEETMRWFEEDGFRDAYDNNPDALWNTD